MVELEELLCGSCIFYRFYEGTAEYCVQYHILNEDGYIRYSQTNHDMAGCSKGRWVIGKRSLRGDWMPRLINIEEWTLLKCDEGILDDFKMMSITDIYQGE